ncbi:hypothetical protein HDU96_006611 [Phlyctochytrium bullatum]|nr:hypothetical protein HDU96_006611 [Phlyctochytrium bullatum]
MKYLPYIDTILVKTQFLVYHNQFLNHLGLVKIFFYDLMRYHFDLAKFPGINYRISTERAPETETEKAELVKDLDESIRKHNVKLAAAFARIRIERRASGSTIHEQMINILPEDVRAKEQAAVDMPKTVRVNLLKTSLEQVAEELRCLGYRVKTTPPTEQQLASRVSNNIKAECIEVDHLFHDHFSIPSDMFSEIKGSSAVEEGKLVTTVILEPSTTGGMIIDKLGYLLQEEEFPNEQCSEKEMVALRRHQINMLKQALSFPSVKNVIYVTRSNYREENEHILEDILVQCPGVWELVCVLPDIINEKEHQWELEECLKIRPSSRGNGVFIAHLSRIPKEEEQPEPKDSQTLQDSALHSTSLDSEEFYRRSKVSIDSKGSEKRSKKGRKKVRPGSSGDLKTSLSGRRPTSQSLPRLSKTLSESVNRLSVPRHRSPDPDAYGDRAKSRGRALRRRDSKNDSEPEDDSSGSESGDEREGTKESGAGGSRRRARRRQTSSEEIFDLGVFGISLKQFYAPQAIALRQIQPKPVDVLQRWKYPVPNPKPWR